jgi:hypothetical protein
MWFSGTVNMGYKFSEIPYLSHRQQKQTVPTAMVLQGISLLVASIKEWKKVLLGSVTQKMFIEYF